MIHKFATIIADSLFKNKIIPDEQKDIYIYGYEILLSSMLNLSLVLISGILLHQIPSAVIFYIVFVITRLYSGGYHADSYLKCNVIFVIVFLLTIAVSKLLYHEMSFVYLIIFLSIYIGSVLEYAPIENANKKLTEENKVKYRKISIWISVGWTVAACILYFLIKEYALTLTITLVMIAILMIVEINSRKEMTV
ncbi:MAG: putative accessory regulator protein [Anaerocolumna sp.]|nr:putative accessory regulator protein [Anaerocolumna sp.]